MIIVIRDVKFDFTNEFPMLIRSAILDSSCFSSEKGMWRAESNEEFNITAEAVDGWMTTENDDVVKPKNCFEFATNSWGKYGEGERAQWATFRPSISRDENAQTLVVIVLHIITIPSAYAGFRVDRENWRLVQPWN